MLACDFGENLTEAVDVRSIGDAYLDSNALLGPRPAAFVDDLGVGDYRVGDGYLDVVPCEKTCALPI